MLFFKPAEEVQADLSCLPRHIAIIMDGNGRWAKKTFYAPFYGA